MKTYANAQQRHDARRNRRRQRRALARHALTLMTPAERAAVLLLALLADPSLAPAESPAPVAELVDDPAAWGLA